MHRLLVSFLQQKAAKVLGELILYQEIIFTISSNFLILKIRHGKIGIVIINQHCDIALFKLLEIKSGTRFSDNNNGSYRCYFQSQVNPVSKVSIYVQSVFSTFLPIISDILFETSEFRSVLSNVHLVLPTLN